MRGARVGWGDSSTRAIDAGPTTLYFAPRKPGSCWCRPNEVRAEGLERAGLMTAAGAVVVAAARADGTPSILDDGEDLVEPADLAQAPDAAAGARACRGAFPRFARRGALEWVLQAKRPDTRTRRIADTATLAARDERADQWRPGTDRARPSRRTP